MTPHPDQHFGCFTYSQHGEDLVLRNLFNLMGIEKPSWIDLGAHHPSWISNTKLFYDIGCRGVNVEANPGLIEAFKRSRPGDINLNVGVGPESGVKTFYMYDDLSGRNTFSLEETKSMQGIMEVRTAINLPVVTLDQIVKSHCDGAYPELLSCDIEGLDYEVLKSANFENSWPLVIIVETRRHETGAMRHMLEEKDFHLHSRMGENLIFIYKSHFSMAY